ncbi:hypothetical protein F4778DRAFT_721212 [Xylariomycetidae sp. FL2044]|nr:hypothetical protein F4778DRAFT_721212 [Xylariomycetidae sp. FL2044]
MNGIQLVMIIVPGIVLIDAEIDLEISASAGRLNDPFAAMYGFRLEDFHPTLPYSAFARQAKSSPRDHRSLREILVQYYSQQPPGCSSANTPGMLGLVYYPARLILAEWMMYTHTMDYYVKYLGTLLRGREGCRRQPNDGKRRA